MTSEDDAHFFKPYTRPSLIWDTHVAQLGLPEPHGDAMNDRHASLSWTFHGPPGWSMHWFRDSRIRSRLLSR